MRPTKISLEVERSLKANSYEIPESDLEVSTSKEQVKKGGSGIVRTGKWQKTTQVAVKMLNNLPGKD